MVTIYDIAKKAGVSASTVSKVFNGYKDVSKKSIELVKKTALELGYIPNINAQALVTKRFWALGVIFNQDRYDGICNPHYSEIIQGFHTYSQKYGYDISIIGEKFAGKKMNFLNHCRCRGIDGVLSVANKDQIDMTYEIYTNGIPCVSVETPYKEMPAVLSDNEGGASQALNYLYSKGHKKIAFISADPNSTAGKERFDAYIKFMRLHNLEINNKYIVYCDHYTYDSGIIAAKRLLEQCRNDLPDSIFCAYDEFAGAAHLIFSQHGIRIPEDISIIGFDDLALAKYCNLTTIRQQRLLIGETAAKILISSIEGTFDSKNTITRIPTKLITRASVKKNV